MKNIPFDPAEITATGHYAPVFSNLPPSAKYNTPLTPRENLLSALSGEMPLWIPRNKDHVTIIARVSPDNFARGLVYDSPERFGGEDMFGVKWKFVPTAGGSMVEPGKPLMEDANDWEEIIHFPDIDSWDWEADAEDKVPLRDGGRAVTPLIVSGIFERLISFMDFDGALIALIDEEQKSAVHSLFTRLTDMYVGMIDRFSRLYDADMLTMHDDWGSQRAPLFSADTCREMILPYLKRVIDACHERGMFFELHSCGFCEQLVPVMIEAGVDYWWPQKCNDVDKLLEQYGGKLLFGIEPDVPLGMATTKDEAVAAAKRLVAKYGPEYAEKPVIAIIPPCPEDYSKTIYEESRKLFYGA